MKVFHVLVGFFLSIVASLVLQVDSSIEDSVILALLFWILFNQIVIGCHQSRNDLEQSSSTKKKGVTGNTENA